MAFLEAEDPLAFEEVLARSCSWPARGSPSVRLLGMLSEAARTALERALLRSLIPASAELLLTEFETMRAQEQSSWDRLFALAQEPEGRSLYRRFVRRLGEGTLARLFLQYPVLARRLGKISHLWVEAGRVPGATGCRHTRARARLRRRRRGAWQRRRAQTIVVGSAPRHAQRRGVDVRLRPQAGVQAQGHGDGGGLPSAAGMAQRAGRAAAFEVLEVLDRSTHGWVEFVEHLPCRDHDEARRYYERAGMLLCLFYVLEGTDCHYENIIASGEYPVLIDTETLMHHRAREIVPEDENAQTEAFEQLGHSVLRTGLLPRWELSADERTAYHVSGLGEAAEQELAIRAPKWIRVNTDRMAVESAR